MVKRKEPPTLPDSTTTISQSSNPTKSSKSHKHSAGNAPPDTSSDDDDNDDILNIDFEFFNPNPIDFHGLKALLRQLFDADADLFDTSSISDLIISQPYVGTTVKCPDDENEAEKCDPFAFITCLNLKVHKDREDVRSLVEYLVKKARVGSGSSSQSANGQAKGGLGLAPVEEVLKSQSNQVGLVLTERLINMPAQIGGPMHTMILEDIVEALEEGEPYDFTHYLVLSKTYVEVDSKLGKMDIDGDENDDGDDMDVDPGEGSSAGRAKKKAKTKKNGGVNGSSNGKASKEETLYFHPEDEVLHRHAVAFGNYRYTKEGADGASDARRAFQEAGIRPMGHMILIEASKFKAAVEDVAKYLGSSTVW